VQAILAQAPPGPAREDVARYASDRLGVPLRLAAGTTRGLGEVKRSVLEAGDRLERRLLAACATKPQLIERYLRPLGERHFDNPLHRRVHVCLVGGAEADRDVVELLAELDATADREGLTEETARELFLRLEERVVRRELAELHGEDLARTVELQGLLTKIQDALQKVVAT
jgi:hypothetical protein